MTVALQLESRRGPSPQATGFGRPYASEIVDRGEFDRFVASWITISNGPVALEINIEAGDDPDLADAEIVDDRHLVACDALAGVLVSALPFGPMVTYEGPRRYCRAIIRPIGAGTSYLGGYWVLFRYKQCDRVELKLLAD